MIKDAIIVGLVLLVVALLFGRSAEPQAMIEPVGAAVQRSDFTLCVPIHNAPLLRGPKDRLDFTPGQSFNDRGDA
jgi:hypothetical protein